MIMKPSAKSDAYWKKKLSPEKYEILREKGTEVPHTGKLLKNKKTGVYVCGACGNPLFSSDTKFDSGTGWPSFFDIMNSKNVRLENDYSMIVPRTEVVCAKCESHLGHVFNEMKTQKCPTGRRFCINSLALDFRERKKDK